MRIKTTIHYKFNRDTGLLIREDLRKVGTVGDGILSVTVVGVELGATMGDDL